LDKWGQYRSLAIGGGLGEGFGDGFSYSLALTNDILLDYSKRKYL